MTNFTYRLMPNFIAKLPVTPAPRSTTILPVILVLSSLTACDQAPQYGYIEGQTMGTSYHIRYKLPKSSKESVNEKAIKAAVDTRLSEINNSMSTYQDDSTITKFNSLLSGQSIEIDYHFVNVLQDAKQVYTQSGGAFDPTVMPLINLWGFGKLQTVDRLQSPPSDEDIAKAKALIDFDSILLSGNILSKAKDEVQIDFSAIAKGYGVDVISDVLHTDYGINNYMVEIGGEVATSGVNAQAHPWTIAIDAPIIDSRVDARQTIAIIRQPINSNKLHLATSGNYRNSVMFNGMRYSHTIDPLTGQPIVGGAPSVTVVAESVSLADAWATALTAMPYAKALKIATANNMAALFVIAREDMREDKAAFDTATSNRPKDDTISAELPRPNTSDSADLSAVWQVIETPAMMTLRAGKDN